jgi:predicted peroxiredoxin
VKFAIIGVGRMGLRHISVAKSLGYDVAGIFDPSQAATDAALKQHDLDAKTAFKSAQEMLANVKPDALVVASTAPSHCEYVCAAAAAGVRYILCEKPMAVSLAECDRMIEACRASGAVLGVNHQMRYMEQYTAVRQLAMSDDLGGLCSMTVAASNIGFAMNASHYVEAFRYLTGETVTAVSAWLDPGRLTNPRGAQYEDRSGQLRAVSASGKRLYMEIGADQGHGLQVIYGCRYGQIYSDQLAGFLRVSQRRPEDRVLPTAQYAMPAVESTIAIAPADVIMPTQALWRGMVGGGSFPDSACGRNSVATIVAANVSGKHGGAPVRIDAAPRDLSFAWA